MLDEDWAVPRPDRDRTREYWSSVCAATHRVPFTPYEAEGRQLIEVVRAGLAVTLCQATFIEVPGVTVRPLTGNPLWYRHIAAWHRAGPLAAHGAEIPARPRGLLPGRLRRQSRLPPPAQAVPPPGAGGPGMPVLRIARRHAMSTYEEGLNLRAACYHWLGSSRGRMFRSGIRLAGHSKVPKETGRECPR
ncbi:hypothetical protein [Streptomyces sp. HUAS TT7]|uniref:hypothetical protein n=1 Tax=Streptomyces sp. HUAS TT7 TaxID=3447507 RepID=UPI003F65E2A0